MKITLIAQLTGCGLRIFSSEILEAKGKEHMPDGILVPATIATSIWSQVIIDEE